MSKPRHDHKPTKSSFHDPFLPIFACHTSQLLWAGILVERSVSLAYTRIKVWTTSHQTLPYYTIEHLLVVSTGFMVTRHALCKVWRSFYFPFSIFFRILITEYKHHSRSRDCLHLSWNFQGAKHASPRLRGWSDFASWCWRPCLLSPLPSLEEKSHA